MSRGELVRLRIRELAKRENWTITEVAQGSGEPYNTVKTYARSPGMTMVDIGAIRRLAKTCNVLIEDLFEAVDE
jgi:putative transcriptional regulator